jgi:hypothetical protein
MRRPIRRALTVLGADQLTDLELHHLPAHGLDRLAQHVRVLVYEQHLPDDLLDRHPVGTGHRWRLLSSNLEKSDDHEREGGRNDTVPSEPVLPHARTPACRSRRLEHGRDLAERAVEMRDGLTQRVACLKERVALKVGRIRAARRPR